jgi:hypothetical protein
MKLAARTAPDPGETAALAWPGITETDAWRSVWSTRDAAVCRRASNARAARRPIRRFPAAFFSPGALPYGEACSISAFNSAPHQDGEAGDVEPQEQDDDPANRPI